MLQMEHSALLSTFIRLPIVIKIFVLAIFEWAFYTGFTVCLYEPCDDKTCFCCRQISNCITDLDQDHWSSPFVL